MVLYIKTNTQFWSYLAYIFAQWEMFQTKFVEKIKTHILSSVTFFRKSYRLWGNVEKYSRAGQATDDNMAHAHCMLDNKGYKNIHPGFVTHCFSAATMVTVTRFNIMLHVITCRQATPFMTTKQMNTYAANYGLQAY